MARILDRGVVGWFTFDAFYKSMVERFPSGSRFVEVGIYEDASFGYLAEQIIISGKSIELIAIDYFGFGTEKTFHEHMKKFPHPYRTIKGDSADSANQFEDKSLDLVFLDADHVQESVSRDIKAWLPKVKDHGVLAGHDVGPEINPDHPGVRKVLAEIFGTNFNYSPDDDVWWIDIGVISCK